MVIEQLLESGFRDSLDCLEIINSLSHSCIYTSVHIHTNTFTQTSNRTSLHEGPRLRQERLSMLKCPLCPIRRCLYSYRWEQRGSVQVTESGKQCVSECVESSLLLAGGAVTSLLSVSPMCRSGESSSVRVSLTSSHPTHACR